MWGERRELSNWRYATLYSTNSLYTVQTAAVCDLAQRSVLPMVGDGADAKYTVNVTTPNRSENSLKRRRSSWFPVFSHLGCSVQEYLLSPTENFFRSNDHVCSSLKSGKLSLLFSICTLVSCSVILCNACTIQAMCKRNSLILAFFVFHFLWRKLLCDFLLWSENCDWWVS